MLKIPNLPRKASSKIKSIAVMTSGGDAPGMNAAVRAVVRYGLTHGVKVHGVMRGYSGLLEGHIVPMNFSSVGNIIQRGGTVLKTARCKEFHRKSVRARAAVRLWEQGIAGMVVIGGDGSYRGAQLLQRETGFPIVGVPGTIDNDIAGTDDTVGFDTAINTAVEAIDRIRDTANSHDRLFIVEVMGRSSGWIAIHVGIGGGAETVIVPGEREPVSTICSTISRGVARGKTSSIIVVAEGPTPGRASRLAEQLKDRGFASRVCILGHIQRGGRPSAHDRLLGSTMGAAAVAYLLNGQSGGAVSVVNDCLKLVPFRKIGGKRKPFPQETLALAETLAH